MDICWSCLLKATAAYKVLTRAIHRLTVMLIVIVQPQARSRVIWAKRLATQNTNGEDPRLL